MNHDDAFLAASNDMSLWEGYEEWLNEQEGDSSWREEHLETPALLEEYELRADYLDWVNGPPD